ncbi:MAG: prepilin-type N-terminal cleavage/methylation domain-containing protein [Bacilli bacterium]|jgi:prepilin-type N-terminal cleavage/methylation domain-containing protein
MLKKEGFTLIELLAVIVILAIILAISIPTITGLIESTTKNAFLMDAKMVIKAIDYQLMEGYDLEKTPINKENFETILKLSTKNYEEVIVVSNEKKEPYVKLVGQNKWAGLTVCGTYKDMKIGSTTEIVCEPPVIAGDEGGWDSNKGVNRPQLAKGMIPVIWDDNDDLIKKGEAGWNDDLWYDYKNEQRWANAVSVHDNEIIAYWVWIPRYVYKITKCHHGIEECMQDNNEELYGEIKISFTRGTDDVAPDGELKNTCEYNADGIPTGENPCANDSNGTWSTHPAFTFGYDEDKVELTGFWVAKFEPSLAGDCTGNNDGKHLDYVCPINILPGKESWRATRIGAYFSAFRNMEVDVRYGWEVASELQTSGMFLHDNNDVDTHLMKNVEWGAVAYLATSEYGKNERIDRNTSYDYYTGGNKASSYTQEDSYKYNVKQSTTGNVTGIYDMSGGAYEYTAAYVNNENSSLTTYGEVIVNANKKYKDVYLATNDGRVNNYNESEYKKGDAIWETTTSSGTTSSWFGEYSYMPYSSGPWFLRGGDWNSSNSGVFYFNGNSGNAFSSVSGRAVVLVAKGL